MKISTFLLVFISLFSWQVNSQVTTYPYLEDFEGGAGGWTVTGGLWALGTPSGGVINTAAGGVNSWATNLTGLYPNGSNAWVTSPVFDFTAVPNPYIAASIWWDSENSWDGTVLQSSINGGATWQNVGALGDPNWYTDGTINGNPGGQQIGWSASPGSLGWINASHDLTGLGGQVAVLLRFAFGSDGSVQDDGFAFDNINIVNLTCPAPTALTATSVLDVSADLAFTEAGTATSWNIEWGPSGFTPGTGTMVTGTASNPYSLTGLSPSTAYSYYVQSDCGAGDLSFWSGPYTFLTACGLIVPAWTDNVDTHTPSNLFTVSNCWNATASSGYDWNITGIGTTPSSNTGALTANSGTNYFFTEASGATAGATCTLVSPVMDASGMTTPTLKFWYHMTGNQMGTLNVEAWDGLVWNVVSTITGEQQNAQSDAFLEKLVYLPGYNILGLQVRFIATSAGSFEGDICIDDISIDEAPSCPAPDPFSIVSSDLTSGTFDWTLTPISTETEWELEYGAVGFTPNIGSGTIMGTTNNPETVSGLAPNSFYEIYVQSVCGVGDSSVLVGPLVFNTYNQGIYMESDTECGAGFIDISATGTALDLLYAGEMDYTIPFPFLFQGSLVQNIAFTSSGYIMLEAAPGQFSATFNQTIANAIYWGLFPFWEAIEADFGNQYYETIGLPGNQTFIVQWDDNNYVNGPSGEIVTFQLQIDEATGEIYYIYDDIVFGGSDAFYDNGNSATIGVKGPNQDVQVSYNNTTYLENNSCAHFYYTDCPKPTNFAVTYTTNDEGAVTWGAGLAGETNWTVIYGVTGFDPATGGTTVTTGTPALIMPGLDDITTYDVYIYADCNPGVLQSLELLGQFVTLPNCSDPTTLATATAVDSLMTTWLWTESSGVGTYPSTGFNLQYGMNGFGLYDGSETIVNADNNLSDTTEDMTLLGGGVYEVYVQGVCGTDTSNWVGPVTFTMPISNDSTCNAIDLAVDGTVYTFDNTGATTQVNEGTIAPPATGFQTSDGWGNSNIDFTTWFTFTAPASGNMNLSGLVEGFDGQFAVYEATDCSDMNTYTLIGANDDALSGTSGAPDFSICGLTPGNTYYLMHDSWSSVTTGVYSIQLDEIIVEAGTTSGILDICTGDTADLFNGISGYDMGGVWTEEITTANFAGSIFPSAGLAFQVFNFEYNVFEGCATDSIIQQVQIYGPSSAGVDGSLTVCLNQPFDLLSGLSGNVDFGGQWYDATNSPVPSAVTAGMFAGSFNYDYITSNGVCEADTANVVVNVDGNCNYLDLQEIVFGNMDIYPNPTTGLVYISNSNSTEVFNFEIIDIQGKVVATENAAINGTELTEINFTDLEVGIYMIKVYNETAEKTFRVVKQ